MKWVRTKNKKYLMFRDEATRKSVRRRSRLLGFFFHISLIALIICAILFAVAIVLQPVLLILLSVMLLGTNFLVWPGVGIPDVGPFIKNVSTAVIVTLILTVAFFALRFVLEWLAVIAESRRLKQNPEGNAPYIAISRIVKRVKIAEIIRFALTILALGLTLWITDVAGLDPDAVPGGQKVMPIILIVILIASPIAGWLFARFQYAKVANELAAVT